MITRSWWRPKRVRDKYPPWSQQPTVFISYKPHENRDIDFSVIWPHVGHWSKGHVWESLTLFQHLVYCGLNTSSAGGYAFYLSHNPTRKLCWDVACIYGWQLLAACYQPEKFGDHRHSDTYKEKCVIKNIS